MNSLERSASVAVISVMGIEDSGLALAALRYAKLLRARGVEATAIVITGVDHAEYSDAVRVSSISALADAISEMDATLLFWVGLHTDGSLLLDQIELMYRVASKMDRGSAVVPERTLLEKRDDYGAFLTALSDGIVDTLVVFNGRQKRVWRRWASQLRIRVVPPPVPREFFELRRARDGRPSKVEFNVVSLGRVSRRKGTDRLLRLWPDIESKLSGQGLAPRLTFVGECYGQDAELEQLLESATADGSSVEWVRSFAEDPRAASILVADVGIALSTQEFDAIAVSEFMAAGVPVVLTPTLGHLAIQEEAPGALLVESDREICSALWRVASSFEESVNLGGELSASIWRSRSDDAVGPALVSALLDVRSV